MYSDLVSIIMVNHNGQKHIGENDLVESIASFLKTDYPKFEFLFVDNNSIDDSIKIAKKVFEKYESIPTRVLRINENQGFADYRSVYTFLGDTDLSAVQI